MYQNYEKQQYWRTLNIEAQFAFLDGTTLRAASDTARFKIGFQIVSVCLES